MKSLTKTKRLVLLTGAFLLVVPSLLVLLPGRGNAATLTNTYLRLNRLKAGQATTFRIVFTTASAGATSVVINFNGSDSNNWTTSSGALGAQASQTDDHTSCATELGGGVLGLPGTHTFTVSGGSLTIGSVTALAATTTYCDDLTFASAVTNASTSGGPNSDGEYHPTVTAGSDSTTVALRTIAEDQIVVTANVPPSFNFQFNNTSPDAFGNLTTAGSSTTGKTITLTTNATSGWVVWAKSAQGASKGSLHSTVASKFITSGSSLGSASHTLGSNVEDYGLATTINTDAAGGGTVSLDTAYDGTSSKLGVLDSQNFRPIASANGTTTGDIINVLERASITGATPAANDYTDTITFIGAGNF